MVLIYRGKRYTDPIDGKSFRTFLPYGYERPRENVLSPSTLSLERHRLLWLYLQKETNFFSSPKKVLHVAPEQAFYKRFRRQANLDYLTTDLHSPLADVKADICDLPFEDEQFDFILCNHVLEHIENDEQAMKELYRVMKKGGTGIFQVPMNQQAEVTFEDPSITDPKDRARVYGQYDHVRMYGLDFFDRLRKVGFDAQAIDYTTQLSDEAIERYRLPKGEFIPLCKKV